MYYVLFFFIHAIIFSQEFTWSRINQIDEGWRHHITTNQYHDAIAVGIDLEGYNPMQIFFREDNDWQQISGTELAGSMTVGLHLSDEQDIYICDFAMGLFKTSNLGQQWTGVGELINEGCSAFNIHPNHTMFIGMTYTGIGFIHRSLDEGVTWEGIPLPDYDSNYPVEHIEFDSQGNIYLGTINGVYKSGDFGESWNKMNFGLDGVQVSAFFIDENDYLYVYTTYSSLSDGMYISTDYANSWQIIPIPDYYVVGIAAKHDMIVIIDGDNHIQSSEDMGNTWNIMDEGLNDSYLTNLYLGHDDFMYSGGRYIHQTNESFSLLGDLNFDQLINVLDVTLLIQMILGDFDILDNGDMNMDNIVNIQDVILLINIIINEL